MVKQETTQISVTLPDPLLKDLDEEVEETGLSRQEIIRQELVDRYKHKHSTGVK